MGHCVQVWGLSTMLVLERMQRRATKMVTDLAYIIQYIIYKEGLRYLAWSSLEVGSLGGT